MFPSPMASNVLYDLISDNKLPPCEGPKLHAFQDRNKPVEFIELLSEPPSDKSGASSGGHGHVFKVRIAKRIYALKIVPEPSPFCSFGIGLTIFAVQVLRRERSANMVTSTLE
jgi:hypothetical protein